MTNGTQLNVIISRRRIILVPLTGDAIHTRVPCLHDFLNFTVQYKYVLQYRESLEKVTVDFCYIHAF